MQEWVYDGVLSVLIVTAPLREVVLEFVQLGEKGCRERCGHERVGLPDPLKTRHFAGGYK